MEKTTVFHCKVTFGICWATLRFYFHGEREHILGNAEAMNAFFYGGDLLYLKSFTEKFTYNDDDFSLRRSSA